MTTLLFSHESSAQHDTGHGHPERPDRIRAVMQALSADGFAELDRREAPAADLADLDRVNPPGYVERLLAAVPSDGLARIDPDTVISPQSGEAALRASGAIIAAIDAVIAGEATNAFCAVRPPGHHAEPGRSMGFCLFNNIAVGALHARAAHGLDKIAVVDFDVHHGNGTQAVFETDPGLLFASSHQYPYYPGTGAASETGLGNVFNVPLDAGAGSAEFRAGFESRILPALAAFRPELILVSAGFDAHAADPLAAIRLDEDDFDWVTRELCAIAGEACDGRLVATLEGGYDLDALVASVSVHVAALMSV
jgi:acetoin utilization deacetylase AcuC-like enzyme